jgi:glutathione reductase (NADPH)
VSDASQSFDLVVLGTGEAGSAAAQRCAGAGWQVAIVDDKPYGGTCALRGCDPKKVLVGAADVVDWARRMYGRGVIGDVRIDWPALMRFKRTFTDPVPASRETAFHRAGIATYHGAARFVSADRLAIGPQVLAARHVLVATGAAPRPLHIAGEEYLRTSTDFLDLDQLPTRIALVGNGYIAFEFAHIVQRAGSHAIIIGDGEPLARFDRDLVARLVAHSRDLGVDVREHATVTGVEAREAAYRVRARTDRGEELIDADLVVHAAGRVPDTGRLDAAAGDVALDADGGVTVNQYLQSVSNPRVYAAGDATHPSGSLPLTPVAAYEGIVVAANLLHGNHQVPDYRGVPTVVFTVPPLASIGLTEQDARRQGRSVKVRREDTSAWYGNRRVAEPAGMVKSLVDPDTDLVLGAHVLGPQAEDVINLFALAMRHGLTATQLRHTLYAYPTAASNVPYML